MVIVSRVFYCSSQKWKVEKWRHFLDAPFVAEKEKRIALASNGLRSSRERSSTQRDFAAIFGGIDKLGSTERKSIDQRRLFIKLLVPTVAITGISGRLKPSRIELNHLRRFLKSNVSLCDVIYFLRLKIVVVALLMPLGLHAVYCYRRCRYWCRCRRCNNYDGYYSRVSHHDVSMYFVCIVDGGGLTGSSAFADRIRCRCRCRCCCVLFLRLSRSVFFSLWRAISRRRRRRLSSGSGSSRTKNSTRRQWLSNIFLFSGHKLTVCQRSDAMSAKSRNAGRAVSLDSCKRTSSHADSIVRLHEVAFLPRMFSAAYSRADGVVIAME